MANVINMGGGGANVQSKTVKSTTAKQTLTPPSGVDGFSPVIVSPMVLQEKTVTLSTSQQVLTPPSGVDGFSKVTVPAASAYKFFTETVTPSDGSTGFSIPAHGITAISSLVIGRVSNISGASDGNMISYSFSPENGVVITYKNSNVSGSLAGSLLFSSDYFPAVKVESDTIYISGFSIFGITTKGSYEIALCGT